MDPLIFLLILSFMMGFVNSITGGGGVFGVPAMIAFGLPPVDVLALNRISDLGNITGSLRNYMKVEGFDKKLAMIAIPPIICGALIGANFIVRIDEEFLDPIIIGAVLIAVVLILYPFKPKEVKADPKWILGIIALLLLGLWEGAFALAGGTFGVL